MAKKSAEEITARAAFGAAKEAAERALDDALLSEEERATRDAEEAQVKSRRRKRRLALIVVGVLIVLGVIGLVLRYWYWFLLLGVVGLLALYGRHRFRKWRGARKEGKAVIETTGTEAPPSVRVEEPAPAPRTPPRRLPAPEPGPSIEDELAELKARVKK